MHVLVLAENTVKKYGTKYYIAAEMVSKHRENIQYLLSRCLNKVQLYDRRATATGGRNCMRSLQKQVPNP